MCLINETECNNNRTVLQTLVYYFYDAAWVLPVAGFAVGYFTNWVALKLIFEPAAPVNLGFYTLQGLFLKRQQEAAKVIAAFSLEYFLVQVRCTLPACMHAPIHPRSHL